MITSTARVGRSGGIYSPNLKVQATIEALLALGCPPIPVAPKQNPRGEWCHKVVKSKDGHLFCPIDKNLNPIPRFTGKNPSYLDENSSPRICKHGEFQNRLPTDAELRRFFCHPDTGVGTLGGHAGVDWIDFDAKCYSSQEACDADVERIISNSNLQNTWIERTGSGGWRVAVKPRQKPTFTNFATSSSGVHIGEALFEGRFTVLAPSVHPNGKRYIRTGLGAPVEIESLEAIGILPSKDEQEQTERNRKREQRKAVNPNYGKSTNPQDNPWDIRNFAHYLEGYCEQGNRWAAGKCPNHNGTSQTSFRVNLDTGEYKLWCGCNTKDVYKSALALAIASGYQFPSVARPEQQAESKSTNTKQYIRPIKELPKVGFHVVRRSQDELLQRFDALSTKRGKEWLKLRQFTPDKVVNSQYFDYDFELGENLAIKSGLGTGKSYFTNAKWLANPDEGAVLGGYRNCLNEQFCANGEKLNGRPWYQIQSDLKGSQDIALIDDPQSRVGGAVDSWIYFAPHHFDGKKVIFDEVESVAKHLNESNTAVSFYREVVKQRVSDALTNSKGNLIADANLTDFTVEYLEKLSGGRKFTKILNEYTGNRGKVHIYNGSCRKRQATEEDVKLQLASSVGEWISFDYKADDYSKMHRIMLDLPTDIPLIILSDSQKKCEAWDRELTELGRKPFRLDSTSSGSDLGKLFLRDSKDFILTEKLDTVILSPSAESGVSIELLDELKRQLPGYFKYEFSYFFGVSVTDTQSQFLGRNRDPYTTRFCYVQSHSMGSTKQITESNDSNDVFTTWIETIKDCASLSLEGLEEGEVLKLALEKIKEQLLNPHLQYEAKLMLKESFERTYPRLCLEYALREAGWEVALVESREDDISDLRAVQEEISLEKATAIFKSEDITPSEADKLAPKLNKSPEERHQITKSKLLSRLPGIQEKVVTQEKKISSPEQLQRIEESELEKVVSVGNVPYEEWKASPVPIPEKGIEVKVEKPAFDPEFVKRVLDKDRHFISRVEAQFLLRNPEICKFIQRHKWHKKLDLITDPDKTSFGGLPVARYRSRWLEIHTLLEMGISFFLDPNNSWHDESPEAVAFWERGKIPRTARNIGVSHEDDPCRYIGKVLQKFALRTQDKRKQKPDGTRYREYSILPIDSLSQAVYECVEQRINSQVSEFVFDWKKIIKNSTFPEPESLNMTELQRVHMAPDNLIKTRGDVDVKLEVKAGELVYNTSSCDESQGVGRQVQKADSRTDLERLVDVFETVESLEEFASVVKQFEASEQQIFDAIAFASSQPRRRQLRSWFEMSQESQIDSSELKALVQDLSLCVNIPSFQSSIHGYPAEMIRAAVDRLNLCDRERVMHYWKELNRRELTSARCQIEDGGKQPDRGGVQIGSLVRYVNPDKLEGCQIYEGIFMKIKRVVEGLLALCELPDGSEESFAIHTLALAT